MAYGQPDLPPQDFVSRFRAGLAQNARHDPLSSAALLGASHAVPALGRMILWPVRLPARRPVLCLLLWALILSHWTWISLLLLAGAAGIIYRRYSRSASVRGSRKAKPDRDAAANLAAWQYRLSAVAENLGLTLHVTDAQGMVQVYPPLVMSAEALPGGSVDLTVQVPHTFDLDALRKQTGRLAAAFSVAGAEVHPVPADASLLHIVLIAAGSPIYHPQPVIDPESLMRRDCTLWDAPLVLGLRADGRRAELSLRGGRGVLLAGAPGAGKSAALALLLSQITARRYSTLYCVDPKSVELAVWRGVARRTITLDGGPQQFVDATLELLRELQAEMQSRYDWMAAQPDRLTKLEPSETHPSITLVVEEMAALVGFTKGKTQSDLLDLVQDYLQRGRAAGMNLVCATQSPYTTVIPGLTRSLFAASVVMRCSRPSTSDVAMGEGSAAAGFDASRIALGMPGTGYYQAEDEQDPRLIKVLYLSDEQVQACADRVPLPPGPSQRIESSPYDHAPEGSIHPGAEGYASAKSDYDAEHPATQPPEIGPEDDGLAPPEMPAP